MTSVNVGLDDSGQRSGRWRRRWDGHRSIWQPRYCEKAQMGERLGQFNFDDKRLAFQALQIRVVATPHDLAVYSLLEHEWDVEQREILSEPAIPWRQLITLTMSEPSRR